MRETAVVLTLVILGNLWVIKMILERIENLLEEQNDILTQDDEQDSEQDVTL